MNNENVYFSNTAKNIGIKKDNENNAGTYDYADTDEPAAAANGN